MTEERSSRQLEKIIVRLPDGMRDRLAELAKAHRRSSNAEAVAALEYWLDVRHRKPTPEEIEAAKREQEAREAVEAASEGAGNTSEAHYPVATEMIPHALVLELADRIAKQIIDRADLAQAERMREFTNRKLPDPS